LSLDVFAVAARHPDSLALVSAGKRLTFAQLACEVELHAAALAARGSLSSGPPIALVARPGLQTLLTIYTLWSYGVSVFPLSPRLPVAEQKAWAARASARALLDPHEFSSERPFSPAPPVMKYSVFRLSPPAPMRDAKKSKL